MYQQRSPRRKRSLKDGLNAHDLSNPREAVDSDALKKNQYPNTNDKLWAVKIHWQMENHDSSILLSPPVAARRSSATSLWPCLSAQ